jgi:hypothetical protein
MLLQHGLQVVTGSRQLNFNYIKKLSYDSFLICIRRDSDIYTRYRGIRIEETICLFEPTRKASYYFESFSRSDIINIL